MRIAVCEDDSVDRSSLREAVRAAQEALSLPGEADFFPDGESMLAAVRQGRRYDLLLLDVYMEGMGGLRAAREARELLPQVQLAFITSSREFAPEAFELEALHYLVKPVEAKGVEELFRRYLGRLRQPPPQLEIRAGNRVHRFPVSLVQKIQSSRKGVDVYLKGAQQPQRVAVPLMKVEEQADPSCFLKVSRGLLVQMEYIESMDRYSCRLKDGTSALLSRKNRSEIQRKYHDFLFWNLMKEDSGY